MLNEYGAGIMTLSYEADPAGAQAIAQGPVGCSAGDTTVRIRIGITIASAEAHSR